MVLCLHSFLCGRLQRRSTHLSELWCHSGSSSSSVDRRANYNCMWHISCICLIMDDILLTYVYCATTHSVTPWCVTRSYKTEQEFGSKISECPEINRVVRHTETRFATFILWRLQEYGQCRLVAPWNELVKNQGVNCAIIFRFWSFCSKNL